jgi:hypothetical protein
MVRQQQVKSPDADQVGLNYEQLLTAARNRYRTNSAYRRIVDPNASAGFLDRFLIEFCSLGVQMTRPVEGWIRRAAHRCHQVGLPELGDALERHATHEADHHLMMIDDTRTLVSLWNAGGGPRLDPDELVNRPPTPGIRRYVEHHETTIASAAPWGQLAIEYEIELLSVTEGPALLGNVARVCGADRLEALTFLQDHIAVDEGHTVFNRAQLNRLITEHPETVASLAAAGAAALDAHALFLADCVDGAE